MSSKLFLSIEPTDALIDVPRHIIVHGAQPHAPVTLSSQTQRAGVRWQAQATYVADIKGQVDLNRDTAVDGSYRGISPMGLIWSQVPDLAGRRDVFQTPVTDALITKITASSTEQVASGLFTQRLTHAGVTRHDIREQGLVGTLYLPPEPGPHPAIMILNGSGGGINEPRAALYAAHGYAAFALAYFKAPGLSDYISNTPLEYFQHGLRWLRNTIKPAHDFVALSGQSRGGELALLLAATFPDAVSAVVAYVPGAVVHSAQNAADPKIGREGPTWLLNGQALPHLWENNAHASWQPFDDGPAPHRHERAILTALQDPNAVARARIPVERIQGPVMLLSATDDGSWPSSLYAAMVRDTLIHNQHPHTVRWLDFQDAGHLIVFPYVPTTQMIYAHPVSGKISTSGGGPQQNAHADAASWPSVLQFLRDAVVTHGARS